MKNQFLLTDKIDETIEVTVRYPGGHGRIAGRVRYVPKSPALWIGDHCFPMETVVTVDRFERDGFDSYTIDTTHG